MIARLVALVLVAWLAAATYVFVLRPGDEPMRADAVFVLSGASERLPVGVALVREGEAPVLVVSTSRKPKPYEVRVCKGAALCRAAEPYSTRGEARLLARLAREHHWRTVDVVTSRFHVLRAKLMIERCFKGRLRVVAAPNPKLSMLAWNYVLESVKLVYHELDRAC